MADYYPLISRAVAGLDKNTGENRRALYDRARAALVDQLRSVEPALDESDITRERLALEEAIRKVESRSGEARASPTLPEPANEPSLARPGLRDFRETVAEAEGLGSCAGARPNGPRTQRTRRCPLSHRRTRAARSPPSPPPDQRAYA